MAIAPGPTPGQTIERVAPIGFFVGVAADTLANIGHGLNSALIRGLGSGLEYAGTLLIPRVLESNIPAVFKSAYVGALVNGARQYAEAFPDSYRSFLTNAPIVGGAVRDLTQNMPPYAERLGDGALVGGLAVGVPLLLIEGGRRGYYGRAAEVVGRGIGAAANGYLELNRRIFNGVSGAFINPAVGGMAGGATVVGLNAAAAYGIGRVAGLW